MANVRGRKHWSSHEPQKKNSTNHPSKQKMRASEPATSTRGWLSHPSRLGGRARGAFLWTTLPTSMAFSPVPRGPDRQWTVRPPSSSLLDVASTAVALRQRAIHQR